MKKETIVILDFGSQYTQLIARRIRELKVYSEIYPYNIKIEKLKELNPFGIILSGGPASVYDKKSPFPDEKIFSLNVPILGLCYGLQIIATLFGGKVSKAESREYGFAILNVTDRKNIFSGLKSQEKVWMSHGDKVIKIPSGFKIIGQTKNSDFAAIADESKKIFGLQFHPEVKHTENGIKIFDNFLKICNVKRNWVPGAYIKETIKNIREIVKNEKVLCAVSGGVDFRRYNGKC